MNDTVRANRLAALRAATLFTLALASISAILINPLVLFLTNAMVGFSGAGFQGNTALFDFVLSPVGLLAILTIAHLVLWHAMIELSGVVIIGWSGLRGVEVPQLRLWRQIIARMPTMALLSSLLIGAGALVVVPISALAAATWFLLLSDADINFYLAMRPTKFLVAAGIFAVLGAAAAIGLAMLLCRWILALPLCVIEGFSARAAMRESAALTKAHHQRRRIFGALLAWFILCVALALSGAWLVDAVEATVLQPGTSLNSLLLTGLALLTVAVVVAVLLRAVAGLTLGFIITKAYARCGREAPQTAVVGVGDRRGLFVERFALAAAITIGIVAVDLALLLDPFADLKPIEVSAHRAGAAKGPENTIAALETAIRDGAQFAEMDVQQTSDGEVVVLHDTDLRRQLGLARSIWEVSWAEIKDLDAGSWFAPEFSHARIATLRQFIEAARGKIRLNIELKNNGHDPNLPEAVVAILHEMNYVTEPVLTSLDLGYLAQLRQLDSRLKLGFIVATGIGSLPRVDVDFYALSSRFATPARIRQLERNGREVHVWTPNTREEMVSAVLAGADNLITDNPAIALEVVGWYNDLSPVERLAIRLRRVLAEIGPF